MRVVWTDRAKARLRQIHTFIAQDQPINAERTGRSAHATCRAVGCASRSGRIVEKCQREDLRELIEAPYRIVYLVLPDRIDIVTVRDTRRVLPRHLNIL
ncbi:MAG: type II toxin-antitoxin system RelE/ParE family toxin [Pseudomonadota bacterium]|nr:type II toxin-antitoxin system RelE/ParE family toxin [Pseudomonadota bacterium]